MKKLILGTLLLSAMLVLTGCLEENKTTKVEDSLIKGAVISSQPQKNDVYLPILDYTIIETTNTYEQPVVTVLYENNIMLIKLYEEEISYSSNLTTFNGTYLKATVVQDGKDTIFERMAILTSEEYLSLNGGDSVEK